MISEAHPLKMAYTSVKYNSVKQVFEISHRVFQDDFENTLIAKYNHDGKDVVINQNAPSIQKAINKFFDKNFSISFNNQKQKLTYIKTEQKNQMGIIIHYETEKVKIESIKTFTIYNYIMMESFSEQVNMFNLNINDQIKQTIVFDINNTKGTINI